MQNAFGEVISVRGLGKVLFDTSNEVATGISRELLLKMNLQPDPKKKKKVELIGEESREFETVQIELVVRGHHFSVCGLVDAVAKDTNLLVGMDVIQQLLKGILLVTNLWYILRISKKMNALCSKLPVNMKVVYRCTCVPDHF